MDRTSGDREKELIGHGGWNEDTKDGGGERNLTLKKKSLKKGLTFTKIMCILRYDK